MKNSIPRYTFYKNKYGSELLIDVVELKYVKKFLAKSAVHTLTYYDITFITEGEGNFSIDNQTYAVTPCDVVFSKPGEIRNWDTQCIVNGYALIFEEEFLSSLFKDSLFVQHFIYFLRWEGRRQNCICRLNFILAYFKRCTILRWKLIRISRMTCMYYEPYL